MVVMVRVAVPGAVPAMLTGLVAPKLKVGGYCAPAGLDVTEAVRATLPVKPPAGVMVMVEAFPIIPPGAMIMAVPVTENVGGIALTAMDSGQVADL